MPIQLKEDSEYQSKWFALSNQYSPDLIYLTVQHLQLAVKNIKLEVEKTDTELKESVTINEYNKTHEELKINMDKPREQLMSNKLKKFERDTKDYQFNKVYKWAEERRRYRKPQVYKGTTGSEDTDGDLNIQEGASGNSWFRKKPQKSGADPFLFRTKGRGQLLGRRTPTREWPLSALPRENKEENSLLINISDRTLTEAEKSVINKGLNYVPTFSSNKV